MILQACNGCQLLMKYEKAWFMIFAACMVALAIDWADSKAVANTALEICVFRQMVHGRS